MPLLSSALAALLLLKEYALPTYAAARAFWNFLQRFCGRGNDASGRHLSMFLFFKARWIYIHVLGHPGFITTGKLYFPVLLFAQTLLYWNTACLAATVFRSIDFATVLAHLIPQGSSGDNGPSLFPYM